MSENVTAQIEGILSKLKPSLGGADVKLLKIDDGIVVLHYQKALTNPSCHANKTQTTEELVAELLEDEFKELVPNFKEITVLSN